VDVKFGKIVYEVSRPGNGGTAVHLTLVSHDDEETLRREGLAGLRRERILRLTREALRQQQVLGYEDLSQLLMTSVATLKRDISLMERDGQTVALRGRRRKRKQEKGL
jgi:hypothetical protein